MAPGHADHRHGALAVHTTPAGLKYQWMWADAQILPGTHGWSQRNPWRWSAWMEAAAVATNLEKQSQKNRPVQMRTSGARGAKIFPTTHLAAEWLRESIKPRHTAPNTAAVKSKSLKNYRVGNVNVASPPVASCRAIEVPTVETKAGSTPRPSAETALSSMKSEEAGSLAERGHASSTESASYVQSVPTLQQKQEKQDPLAEEWERLVIQWQFLQIHAEKHDAKRRGVLREYLRDAVNWGIAWDALEGIRADVLTHFSNRPGRSKIVDVVRDIVVPECRNAGAPCALVRNGWQIMKVVGFVSHAWQGEFAEFMSSLQQIYSASSSKPSLFISAFAIFQDQGFLKGVSEKKIDECPFTAALCKAEHFTAIRNSSVDMYLRTWCLLEHIYAQKSGLFPEKTQVSGPNTFVGIRSTCLDAQASGVGENEKILDAILSENDVESVDAQIVLFRNLGYKKPNLLQRLSRIALCCS
eukprot:TRINITY_DN94207_c0_g1_i1.p1 TRINITY_DN94207_c0_g1~~TRINITY_DN94207_c0_g1_i1.p1  ORF type:complete len:470 (-),score=67.95 TRINITY_DN94207_c0_g1_i1:67-1476(-)